MKIVCCITEVRIAHTHTHTTIHLTHHLLMSVVYNLTTDLMCKHNFRSTRILPSHFNKRAYKRSHSSQLRTNVCVRASFVQPLQRLIFKICDARIYKYALYALYIFL